MESIRKVKDGVLLEVGVKPNSDQTSLYKKDDKLILELQSPPEDNKANIEALKFLKKLFGCEVSLVRGNKSKDKIFLVQDTIGKVEKLI